MYDRLVIGGGVAGVAAALELAAAGARVALVRAAPGASALASGGWNGPLPERLGTALSAAGLRYLPAGGPLPHPAGLLRPYDFAAESHLPAPPADAHVVGIAGLPGQHAPTLARLWGLAGAHVVTLPDTPAAGWSPVSLAAVLERDATPLLQAVGDVAGGAAAIVLPAVLGLAPARLLAAFRERLGVPVTEALGVPPSVPGWRLDRALLACLAAAGIERIDGRVTGREAAGRTLAAVSVQNAAGLSRLAAGAFVLATGRFVGGGIGAQPLEEPVAVASGSVLRDAPLVEGALGCAVWVEHLDQRFTVVQPVSLTDAVRAEPQPLLAAGVHVDAAARPIDLHGHVIYDNVTAVGAVVAGPAAGLGHAAAAAVRSAGA